MIEVTQEDRIAAATHHGEFCNAFGPTPMGCSCDIEQSFARHRIAAEQRGMITARDAAVARIVEWSPDLWGEEAAKIIATMPMTAGGEDA